MADFIDITSKLPSKSTIMELVEWSFEQTKNPVERKQNGDKEEVS